MRIQKTDKIFCQIYRKLGRYRYLPTVPVRSYGTAGKSTVSHPFYLWFLVSKSKVSVHGEMLGGLERAPERSARQPRSMRQAGQALG